MAQTSYIWDGTVTGDASLAPYDKDNFGIYAFLPHIQDDDINTAYVVAGYLEDLRVTGEVSSNVTVAPGAAIHGGKYLFVSDAEVSLTVDAITETGFFRYDYVVLRLNTDEQTVRLAIVKGIETNDHTALTTPTIQQTSLIREIPLAQLYVTSDYNYIREEYIYDLRVFAANSYTRDTFKTANKNLLMNSEFMAFSAVGTATGVPEGWDRTDGTALLTAGIPSDTQSRGHSVRCDGDYTMQQIVIVDPEIKTYTLKGMFEDVVGGLTSEITISMYPAARDGTILGGYDSTTDLSFGDAFASHHYLKLAVDTYAEFQYTITFDDNAVFEAIVVEIAVVGSGMEIGQLILVGGYHPGPWREFSEVLMLYEALTDANWSDTAKSSGTTSINVESVFDVPEKTRDVFVRLLCRDSGSAAGTAYLALQGYAAPFNSEYGRVEVSGLTNDIYRSGTFRVPVNQPLYDGSYDADGQLRAVVAATGAGTLDATLEIVGIVT